MPGSAETIQTNDASRSARALAAAAALLERSVLAQRLHNGPLQDIAATMLELQALAERAHPANRGAIDDAIAILVGQQRVIREMVESMLAGELATKVAIAPVLDALAMQWRQTGRKLTWTIVPPDAALDASDDLAFRLKLLETLGPIEAPALAVDVRAGETLDVTLSGASLPTVRFSMEAGA